jgi:transcriptional regulator of acetoin/glycerol metabolism
VVFGIDGRAGAARFPDRTVLAVHPPVVLTRRRKGYSGLRLLHDEQYELSVSEPTCDSRTFGRLQQENVALREEIDKASMFEEIVGNSPALKSALSRISKVAPSDSTVLITGETGTGKELVARAIHRNSCSSRTKRGHSLAGRILHRPLCAKNGQAHNAAKLVCPGLPWSRRSSH